MFVCELDEAVGDISPSVETNHLGLHIPTGSLEKNEESGRLKEKATPPCTILKFPQWTGSFE